VAIRTSEKTVTFTRPFVLSGFDQLLQAGAYRVETDEELLEGVSFPAYRRILTLLHLDVVPGQPGVTQTLTVDPKDLGAALERDGAPPQIPRDLRASNSLIDLPQPLGQTLEAMPPSRSEPNLSDVISDPIVRSIMLSDRLSAAAVWRAFEKARADLIARTIRETTVQTVAGTG
jgi:hypothetical protein